MLRTLLVLFFFGGLMGTLGDYSHVVTRTLGYPDPLLPLPGGQPIWVPFLFGAASAGIGLSHIFLLKQFKILPSEPVTLKHVIQGSVFFQTTYSLSGFLPLSPTGLRDALLYPAAGLCWFFLDRSWQGAVAAFGTAIVGTAVEVTLCKLGAFYYFPEVTAALGVPSWLPALYLIAAVAVGNFTLYLYGQSGGKLSVSR